MPVKAMILRGDRRAHDVLRQIARREMLATSAIRRERLVQDDTIAVDDRRRRHQSRRRNRTASDPDRKSDHRTENRQQTTDNRFHRFTSITLVAVLPNTSGSYISSACAGAAMNTPAVVARSRYLYS